MSKKVYGEWTATQGLITVGGPIEDGDIATKGWVKGYVSGGGNITVDDALSDTSENPVQNKVIKKELDKKQPKGNYITNTVDNLVNYYKKAETYTKTEVDNLNGS